MGRFVSDLRFAARSIRREPGYALAFVLTLGLGIGANAAIFSLVNGVLLRPLPYPDADRIAYLKQPITLRGVDNELFSFVEIQDLREQSRTLDQLVEFGDWTFNVLDRGDPHRANGGLVTANFFDVLGIRPLYGRLLRPSDRARDAQPVAVLTYDYWMRCCDGDPEVIGQALNLTRKVATIVGVLEPGSHYATRRGQDFYVNYAANDHYSGASMQEERTHRMTEVFARLAPGATMDQAQAELDQIYGRLQKAHPDAYPEAWGVGIEVVPWKDELTRQARPTLLLLLGTAAFVLLIACANVANLTLTRLNRREHELAIRTALGAGRAGLRRLLLAETLALGLLGGGLGLLLAYEGLGMLVAYVSRFTARTGEISIDPTVLAFTVVVAAAVAVAFALAPGLGSDAGVAGSLVGGGGHATAGRARRRLQRALVVGQIALSFTLLVGAGLLARTLINLYAVDPGYELDSVLRLEAPTFTPLPAEQARLFADSLIRGVEAQAGVDSAALADRTPLGGTATWSMFVRTDDVSEADARAKPWPTVLEAVTPGYFRTLGVSILEGRGFRSDDIGQPVAIVNQSFARRHFGEARPVGRRFAYSWGGPFQPAIEIVGVVADTRSTGLESDPAAAVYRPATSADTVLVRTARAGLPVAAQVVERIRDLDPERPIEHIETLAEVRSQSIAPQRLNATLFGLFAVLALLIAAVGIAGVLAYSVAQRRREFGIRVALGADRARVLRQVLGEGGVLTLAGLALGALGAVLLSRTLAGLLYRVEPLDPLTFAGTGLVLAAVALGASLLPARRATGVDPVETLRAD